jgi:LIVCS family branched-chain amino acid:cation transporter
VQILTAYVQHTFGRWGMVLLAVVILLACLTTGVGLVSACGSYFGQLTGWGYRRTVVVLSLFSLAVSNQGLEQLIALAEPVLVAIYPLAIALVALSLLSSLWKSPGRVHIPTMAVALVLGICDAAKAVAGPAAIPQWLGQLPGASVSLGWTLPVLATALLAALADRLLAAPAPQNRQALRSATNT